MWVVGQVERYAAPLDLEGIRPLGQAREGRAVVGECCEVLILADDPLRRVGRGPWWFGDSRGLGRAGEGGCLADSGRGVVCARGGNGGIPPGLAMRLQVSALPLEPQPWVDAEGLGHLRLELQGESVLALSRGRGLAEEALDTGSHMFLDDTLGREGLIGGEEGGLLDGRPRLRVRVEDGVADEGGLLVGRDALDDLGGGRDGWRDGEVGEGR